MEYLIPTNNIIVLDSYFNLTSKSDLINRIQYDLIRLFDHLVVAYFLGHPVYQLSNANFPLNCSLSEYFPFPRLGSGAVEFAARDNRLCLIMHGQLRRVRYIAV